MEMLFQILKWIGGLSPFIIICIIGWWVNLKKERRGYQFIMPVVAIVYSVYILFKIDPINVMVLEAFGEIVDYLNEILPFEIDIDLEYWLIYVSNAFIVVLFWALKIVMLPILYHVVSYTNFLVDEAVGVFYNYSQEFDKWFVKDKYTQVRFFIAGMHIAALVVSCAAFIIVYNYDGYGFTETVFYPAFGILIIGEFNFLLRGLTKKEYIEDIMGEDEESYHYVNYGALRSQYEELFSDRLTFLNTIDNSDKGVSTYEILDSLKNSHDSQDIMLYNFFTKLKESGDFLESNNIQFTYDLMNGKSILVNNPFYRDMTPYILLPLVKKLLSHNKCLITVGRDALADDIEEWIRTTVVEFMVAPELWKVELLDEQTKNWDIGVLQCKDFHNLFLLDNHKEALSEVGMIIHIEPSRVLATGQLGLSLIASKCGSQGTDLVQLVIDRNHDGLVDALSHALRTNLTEVFAPGVSRGISTNAIWKSEGPYMHHSLFPSLSRYMGVGTELTAVGLQNQVDQISWLSCDKFPVIDMHWIVGQYYEAFCNYTKLPVSQEVVYNRFDVDANFWKYEFQENGFYVVEDEMNNVFEMARLFDSRIYNQGFIHVISDNYMLRDYMIDNSEIFVSDAKAIPTFAADFAQTERNTVFRLLMEMNNGEVEEAVIIDELMRIGIVTDDVEAKLKELIAKHCHIDNVIFRISTERRLSKESIGFKFFRYYTIAAKKQLEPILTYIKNVYFVTEEEDMSVNQISSKLFGLIHQVYLPKQFVTHSGKYYEISSISADHGVVMRRAADHIVNRKSYHQIRKVRLGNWLDDDKMGASVIKEAIEVYSGYCDLNVSTDGYYEMLDRNDFADALKVRIANIPDRSYKNKHALRIVLPSSSKETRFTLCFLLNELFVTVFPDNHHYVFATMGGLSSATSNLKEFMYELDIEDDSESIYIIEDSVIDLGLITTVERNINRFFDIIADYLHWHLEKMNKLPGSSGFDGSPAEFLPREDRSFTGFRKWLRKWIDRIRGKSVTGLFNDGINSKTERLYLYLPDEEPIDLTYLADSIEEEVEELEEAVDELLDGENEPEFREEESSAQENDNYLLFGFELDDDLMDVHGTLALLGEIKRTDYIHDTRESVELDWHKGEEEEYGDPNAPRCDFCGVLLKPGGFDVLHDERCRCNECSSTALKTEEEFKELYKVVVKKMEAFFGVKYSFPIKVRMVDSKKIAKHLLGMKDIPITGYGPRAVAYAKKDRNGYTICIENGAPKLMAIANIVHELTHIYQYKYWDMFKLRRLYGRGNMLQVEEGMAVWAEIQYLYLSNEYAYARRSEKNMMHRIDEYGHGFREYIKKYPLLKRCEVLKCSPFFVEEPL